MLKDISSALRPSIVLTLLFALLLCGVYPLVVTLIGQAAFPAQAEGSLIRDARGQVIGSSLLGQNFTAPGYFHGRPSAAGKDGNDPTASSGSNLGPTSQVLADRVKADLAHGKLPADLVTTSGSGLDPHITPAGALAQVDRVAAARGIPAKAVRDLVARHTEQPLIGVIGEPRVNVLLLNRALDGLAKRG